MTEDIQENFSNLDEEIETEEKPEDTQQEQDTPPEQKVEQQEEPEKKTIQDLEKEIEPEILNWEDIKIPEEVELTTEQLQQVDEIFKANNITSKEGREGAIKGIVALTEKLQKEAESNYRQKVNEAERDYYTALFQDPAYGAGDKTLMKEAYKETKRGMNLIDRFDRAGENLYKNFFTVLEQANIANHPAVLKVFRNFSRAFTPDTTTPPKQKEIQEEQQKFNVLRPQNVEDIFQRMRVVTENNMR